MLQTNEQRKGQSTGELFKKMSTSTLSNDLYWLPLKTNLTFSETACRDPSCAKGKSFKCRNREHIRFKGKASEHEKFAFYGWINHVPEKIKEMEYSYASLIFLFLRREIEGLFVEKALCGFIWDFIFSDFNVAESINFLRYNTLRNQNVPKKVISYIITPFCLLAAFFSANSYLCVDYDALNAIQHTLEEPVKKVCSIYATKPAQEVDKTTIYRSKVDATKPHILKWKLLSNACFSDALAIERRAFAEKAVAYEALYERELLRFAEACETSRQVALCSLESAQLRLDFENERKEELLKFSEALITHTRSVSAFKHKMFVKRMAPICIPWLQRARASISERGQEYLDEFTECFPAQATLENEWVFNLDNE
jgi:hypothetical protein